MDFTGTPEAFAVCKAADISSTALALRMGVGYESNPITAKLIANSFAPLLGVSVAVYYFMKKNNTSPTVNRSVSGITCAAAVGNLMLLP